MIGYVTLGSANIERAAEFYDKLFEAVGGSRVFSRGSYIAWSNGVGEPMVGVLTPANGEPPNVANGSMIALKMKDIETVDKLHALALDLGAENQGDPGFRSENFYAAFFKDLDGHKFNFYCKPDPH